MAAGALWDQASCDAWAEARDRYPDVVEAVGGERLVSLDRWYHGDLPRRLRSRDPAWIGLDELQRVVEWKMRRGVFRPRNLALVRSNDPREVEQASRKAFAQIADLTRALAPLTRLRGVGPATASAVLAAARPDLYPFFDDVVAEQIPELGRVDFTVKAYRRYVDRLTERSALLSVACPDAGWSPHAVGCALWASVGGKSATIDHPACG